MYEAGHPMYVSGCSETTQRDMREGGGTGVQVEGDTYIPVADSC